jgi:solute carrier family 25 carnitine/acylcarnitine transporter 20/29
MSEKKDFRGLIPGFLQGITRVTISYPADVVKVQMQKLIYTKLSTAIRTIVTTDPFKLYRGSSIAYATIGIGRSIEFYFLEQLNKHHNPFVSSFAVSIITSLYNVPMQFITTNIALQKKEGFNLFKYLKSLVNNKVNVLRGFFIETPKSILGSTIYLGTYMTLRKQYNNVYMSPFLGGFSSVILWIIIFPIDTIKTLYQTENTKLFTLIKTRYKMRGLASFYTGITPVLLRAIPSASAGMFVYESTKKWLKLS